MIPCLSKAEGIEKVKIDFFLNKTVAMIYVESMLMFSQHHRQCQRPT